MFWLHSGSKDGFERKQGDFLVESKNIRRSHSARAYFHTFILSYFQYLKNITHCSTTRSIYILSHIISNQYLSWYITNHCDFLWGERTNDMLSLTDAYHQYPGYYTPTIPCIETKHVSCSREKMQKAIHQEKNLSTRGKCTNLSTRGNAKIRLQKYEAFCVH